MSKELVYRDLQVKQKYLDTENRTVRVAFSSETPYARYDYFNDEEYLEVLGHKDGEVDLQFLSSGSAPLLLGHDQNAQIGVIESVSVEGGVGRALLRFSRAPKATEIWDDVKDGIRKNISVGYYISEEERDGEKDGVPVRRATKWHPKEVSIVSIPADANVGVGREADINTSNENNNTKQKDIDKMDKKENKTPEVDVKAIERKAAASEKARVREISNLGAKYDMDEKADDFIESNKTAEEFRAYVLENLDRSEKKETPAPSTDANIGLTEKEAKEYSFMRALRTQAFPKSRQFEKEAGFELECHRAAAEKMAEARGTTAQGIVVPHDVLTRDLSVGTATAGGNLVSTDLLSGSFIELLRNKMIVKQAGAIVLSGLEGNVAIPRQSGAGTAYWVTEGNAPTESQQTINQVTLAPKTIGAFTDYTRQLLLQSSIDIEMFVKNDLATILAIGMDYAALYGSGSSGQPTGLKNQSGVKNPYGSPQTITPFAAAVPTFAEVVNLETQVATQNADNGKLAYITDPSTRGGLKTKSKAGTEAIFVWENNEVNGYPAHVSNQVTSGDVFYGNWADLLIGMWGGLDLTVDPYSNSTSGTMRIVALQSCDVAIRHAESFVLNSDG